MLWLKEVWDHMRKNWMYYDLSNTRKFSKPFWIFYSREVKEACLQKVGDFLSNRMKTIAFQPTLMMNSSLLEILKTMIAYGSYWSWYGITIGYQKILNKITSRKCEKTQYQEENEGGSGLKENRVTIWITIKPIYQNRKTHFKTTKRMRSDMNHLCDSG